MTVNFNANDAAQATNNSGLVVVLAQLNEIFEDVRTRAGVVRALSADLVKLGQH